MTATDDAPEIVDQHGRPLVLRKPATLPQSDVLTMAIEKGMDADGIAKLVDLIERRERQAAEREYTDAIRYVSEKAGVIIKSKKGSKSQYAPLDEINYLLTPLYTGAGLSLSFSEADCPFADKGWKRHVCDVRHKSGHKERYHLDLPIDNADGKNPGMTPIQSAISTGSYCQRVLLCRIFNLTIALTDLDGGNGSAGIEPAELAEIKDLWDQLEALRPQANFELFLEWLNVAKLEELTVKGFEKARSSLRNDIAKAKGAAK